MPLNESITVLDIQRMSTEDGPGLRTTLFLKGCSLHCGWCHNPESIDARPLIQWNAQRCIGCGSCRDICKNNALVHAEEQIWIEHSKCILCQTCVEICPSGALHLKGEPWQKEVLLKELLKDRVYFGREGGITLSGGEPLLQDEAAIWLLENIKREGVATALDTAGLVKTESLLAALEFCDLLLYDLKLYDSEQHERHTGSGNEKILANLIVAIAAAKQSGTKIWIRTPLIPEVTANAENIAALAQWLAKHSHNRVERWELCAFNNLCENKYRMLNLNWEFRGVSVLEKAQLNYLEEIASNNLKNFGASEIIVQWTGSAAVEKTEENDEESGDAIVQ
jgi:pyruvate formate lyase activating enzyme